MAFAVVRLGGIAVLLAFLPAQSEAHSLTYAQDRCGGLSKNWPAQGLELQPKKNENTIYLGGNALRFNGVNIDGRTLKQYFSMYAQAQPQPFTVAVIDSSADCTKVTILRREMENQLQCTAHKRCVEYSANEWSARKMNN